MFYSNKRYNEKQIEDITTAILNYGTTGEESSAKIQEMIQKSARADVYHKTKIYQGSRTSVDSNSSIDSETSPMKMTSPSNYNKFDFVTEAKFPKVNYFTNI